MRRIGLWIDACVLSCISLGSIGLGFWVFRLSGSGRQIAVQLPVALFVGTAGMVWWMRRSRGAGSDRGRLAVLVSVLLLSAVLVVAGHFLVTGYLTALGNVLGAWSVLLVQMAVAFLIATAPAGARRGG